MQEIGGTDESGNELWDQPIPERLGACPPGRRQRARVAANLCNRAVKAAGRHSGASSLIMPSSWNGLYGFARYAEAPASLARCSSPLRAKDVIAMIGVVAVAGSARSARVASMPEIFG